MAGRKKNPSTLILIDDHITLLVSNTKSKLINSPADRNELNNNRNLYFFVLSAIAPNTPDPINPHKRKSAPNRLLLSLEFLKL